MKHEYYKLVRDKIPEIMKQEGNRVSYATMTDKEYLNELDLKLQEECKELLESHDISEFVDVLEVLEAIAKARHLSWEQVLTEKGNKASRKGKFERKLFLEYTEG